MKLKASHFRALDRMEREGAVIGPRRSIPLAELVGAGYARRWGHVIMTNAVYTLTPEGRMALDVERAMRVPVE